MRLLYALILSGMCGGVSTPLLAQSAGKPAKVAATDLQQQSLEVAAARAMAPLLVKESEFGLGKGIALDSRLYSAWSDMIELKDWDDKVPPSSANAPSHTLEHLREIATILGVTEFVEDKRSCIVDLPRRCRIGDNAGLLMFSPAVIVGKTGYIALKLAVPVPSNRDREMVGTHTFTLALTDSLGSWVVSSITRTGGH